jgi:hypothetical protein
MSPLATLSFLVIAIWPLAGAAEQPSHTSLRACELLTAAELETAVGGSVAQQSIGPTGSGDALSMEKVAALAENAASRVPPQ